MGLALKTRILVVMGAFLPPSDTDADDQAEEIYAQGLRLPAADHLQMAALVKLRYFAGLTMAEAAEVIGISVPTAEQHWAFARAWLFRDITQRKAGPRECV